MATLAVIVAELEPAPVMRGVEVDGVAGAEAVVVGAESFAELLEPVDGGVVLVPAGPAGDEQESLRRVQALLHRRELLQPLQRQRDVGVLGRSRLGA